MPLIRLLLLILCAAILSSAVASAFAPAVARAADIGRILAVEAADSGGLRIAIDSERRGEPRVYTLDEPMRLVVDLGPGRWSLAGPAAARGPVGGWRFGRGEGQGARLVVDLASPVQVRKVGYDLGAPRGGARLLIELEPVARAAFAAGSQPWRRTSELLRDVYAPPADPPRPAARPVALPQPAAQAAPAPAAPAQPAATRPAASQVAAAAPAAVPRALPGAKAPGRMVVVIDPGHGGQDPGAIGGAGTQEKMVTLAVAREVRRQLEATGRYRVHLTRDGDHFLPLRERVQKARRWRADLFVSIHADSIGSDETRGASVYTLSDTASDAEAAALAARENRADIIAGLDLSHESRDVANILIDLAQRETLNRSADFARLLVRELGQEVRMLPTRPHRFAGFAVLKAPDIPAALVELGYLSNAEDERLLRQGQHRRRVAAGIQRAVDAFFAAPPQPR
jgi:N-acetylmuramoyl-L-alanine amidase